MIVCGDSRHSFNEFKCKCMNLHGNYYTGEDLIKGVKSTLKILNI